MKIARWMTGICLLFAGHVCGSIPPVIRYQGLLTDTTAARLDTTLSMSFALFEAPTGGTPLWRETHADVEVRDGLFAVELGSLAPIPDSLFMYSALYLAVDAGGDGEMTPRSQVTSNCYAYRVNALDGAQGGVVNGLLNLAGDLSVAGRQQVNGAAVFADSLSGHGVIAFDGPVSISNSASVNGATSVSGAFTVENSGSATAIYSNAAHTEGVILPVGSSCWMPVDTTDSCGVAASITSVNGLSGGTITSDITISGKLNVGGAGANLNPGTQAFVSGSNNRARGNYATVGGGGGALLSDSNAANGTNSAVAGGRRNLATGQDAFIGGGAQGGASGLAASVLGGSGAKARGDYSTTCGGGGLAQSDSNYALSPFAFVGGGMRNGVGTTGTPNGATFGIVVGGRNNGVSDSSSAIVGGNDNSIAGDTAFIGGGYSNSASGDLSVIAGGYDNTTLAGGEFAFIGAGIGNSSNGSASVCVGGSGNTAGGAFAANSGGFQNVASGAYAAIPGGWGNSASGRYAIACGRFANASHAGSFVWSDTTGSFNSQGENTFAVRATNGVFMFTSAAGGARLPSGSSVWTSISDSTKKRNIRPVNTADILNSVVELPIKQWSYKSQDEGIEHVGPMAQDFWSRFKLGDDSLSISSIDPAGIALAAIQELAKQNETLRGELRQLRSDVLLLKQEKSAAMVRNESGK